MRTKYECNQQDAQQDWQEFAEDVRDGAEPPPNDLLDVVAAAAGGLPENVTAEKALQASAELLKESEAASA